MALVLADRVKETTSTTGTGALSLGGAETNFASFSSVLSDTDTTYYCIVDDGNADYEVGLGTYASGTNTLARTTILASSNAGSVVNLGSGSKVVFITYPAGKAVAEDGSNNSSVAGTFTAEDFIISGGATISDFSSGEYGSVEINGGATGGFEGYSIGGRVTFMHNGTTVAGIYNDVNNQWLARATLNAEIKLYYAGSEKLTTASGGVSVTGTITATGIADVVNTREDSYSLTGTAISAANGAIQYKTLAANTTFTESLADGDSVLLRISGGDTYTVTWPTITWVTGSGDSAPTLGGSDVVILWQEGSTVYGAYVGSYA